MSITQQQEAPESSERKKKAATITRSTELAWASNIIKRVRNQERVSARDLEKASFIISAAADGKESAGSQWARNQVELAEALGTSRKTIQRWLSEEGSPKTRSDGRYDVRAWKEWAEKAGKQTNSGDESQEFRELEIRRLRTICERLDLELEIQRGNYTHNDEIVTEVRRMVGAARKVLAQMPSQLAPQLGGLPPAEIESRIMESVNRALHQLHTEKWPDDEESNQELSRQRDG